MEILKKFESGKTKVQHGDVVIFVKPYMFGSESGMIVRSRSRVLTRDEVETAYKLATGEKAKGCRVNGNNWEVR